MRVRNSTRMQFVPPVVLAMSVWGWTASATAEPLPRQVSSHLFSAFHRIVHKHHDHVSLSSKLPYWTDSFVDITGQTDQFTMVGTAPSTNNAPTIISVLIIPVKMVYGPANGNMTFDPKKDKAQNKKTVIDNIKASPIFQSTVNFGKYLGKTQYADAFQRGNFWSDVKVNTNYHVLLGSPQVLAEQTITVSPSQGQVITNPYGTTKVGTMDYLTFVGYLDNFLSSNSNVNSQVLTIFVTNNIFLWNNGQEAAVGYHDTYTDQNGQTGTYAYATYVEEPGSKAQDVSTLSHEVSEWMDDPFVSVATNMVKCLDNGALEVADPMEDYGSYGAFPYSVDGFTYHLADLAFLGYFGVYGDPRKYSIHKWLDFQNQQKSVPKHAVCYAFGNNNDGRSPNSDLAIDANGNLFGTTLGGPEGVCYPYGCGTAFKLVLDGTDNAGTEIVLHTFGSGIDGWLPHGVVFDKSGNLFGTTQFGGDVPRCGTAYKLAPDGTESLLYTFRGCEGGNDDASEPAAGLIIDASDNLLGTGPFGGGCDYGVCGAVFKVTQNGTETLLHAFTGGADGSTPYSSLTMDKYGNLYGTTMWGGGADCANGLYLGCGTVFKIASNGTESVLYAFKDENDGAHPSAGLVIDKQGNLYGTTEAGGGTSCLGQGCGTVFKIAPGGTLTVVHTFVGGNDGAMPAANLILDKSGNLYGTTQYGGDTNCSVYSSEGCGVVFKLAPDGTDTVLYTFPGGSDGALPSAGLVMDKRGNLYGTTWAGGNTECGISEGCGTVFVVTR